MRRQHLRARMINRHKHAVVPRVYLRSSRFQTQLMRLKALQRLERNRTQRHDHLRIYELDRAFQESRTVSKFFLRRFAIRSRLRTWITQRSARDENFFAREFDRSQKPIEIGARLIAGKRYACSISPLSSRRFADEHDACVRRSVEFTQDCAAPTHRRTPRTRSRFFRQHTKQFSFH